MAYKTFFFQEGIYQTKKQKQHFSFLDASSAILFGNKKMKSKRMASSASSYLTGLDSALFGDKFTLIKKNNSKSSKFTFPYIRFFFISCLIILSIAGISIFAYIFVTSHTPILDEIMFKNEESSSKLMEEIANVYISEKTNVVTNIPQMMKEVVFQNYIVKKGDTIGSIAYKMGLRKVGTIISANNITNARRIMTGTQLTIPSMDGIIYVVQKNDDVQSIAKSFNVKLENLLDANDIAEEAISVGRKLFIPGASMPTEEIKRILGELFIYPIRGRLTSPFGYRRDPFTGRRSFHSGIDLAAPVGTPIKVVMDGTISEMNFSRVFGNYVIVTHANGYQSLYGHVSKFKANRGQKVTQGTIIALVGNTGMSTGPHVHLSIYKNGNLLDPLTLLK